MAYNTGKVLSLGEDRFSPPLSGSPWLVEASVPSQPASSRGILQRGSASS